MFKIDEVNPGLVYIDADDEDGPYYNYVAEFDNDHNAAQFAYWANDLLIQLRGRTYGSLDKG